MLTTRGRSSWKAPTPERDNFGDLEIEEKLFRMNVNISSSE
jgi:hypothetical protein